MKVRSMVFCCVLALVAANAVWAADAQNTTPTTEGQQVQPMDANGKPMTAQEFDQAYQARLDARKKAVQDRMEARQNRLKKMESKTDKNETQQ